MVNILILFTIFIIINKSLQSNIETITKNDLPKSTHPMDKLFHRINHYKKYSGKLPSALVIDTIQYSTLLKDMTVTSYKILDNGNTVTTFDGIPIKILIHNDGLLLSPEEYESLNLCEN